MDERTLNKRLKFIDAYKKASNAATGSAVDANANVTSKNIATMSAELPKPEFIDINSFGKTYKVDYDSDGNLIIDPEPLEDKFARLQHELEEATK